MANMPADPNVPAVSITSGLADAFPRQAEEEEAGITGANTIKMQQLAGGVSQGTTTAPNSGQISQAGAQMASDAATKAAASGEQAGQKLAGAESAQLAGEQVQAGANEAEYQRAAAAMSTNNNHRLSQLSQSTQQSLVDEQMQFQTQQIGQGVLNETQLADWSVQNAKSTQQLQDNMQTIQLANQRYLELLQAGYQATVQQLQDVEAGKIQNISNADRIALEQAKSAYQLAVMQQQAKIKNQQSMISAAGTVAGGVAGGMMGGPVGAMAGSQIGGGVGAVAGSAS